MNLAQSAITESVEATKPDLSSVSQEEDYDIPEDVENVIGKSPSPIFSCLCFIYTIINAVMHCTAF